LVLPPVGHCACSRSLPQDLAKFFSGGCLVTLGGAGDADGHQFRRSGDGPIKQTFASHEFKIGMHNAMPRPASTSMRPELVVSHSTVAFLYAEKAWSARGIQYWPVQRIDGKLCATERGSAKKIMSKHVVVIRGVSRAGEIEQNPDRANSPLKSKAKKIDDLGVGLCPSGK
jgi:hypothetical protein